MYYDANGADYIQTPSFAIPNTGILTVEAWMKSVLNVSETQAFVSHEYFGGISGYINFHRISNSNILRYSYHDGTTPNSFSATDFFQNLDNQYIHIVIVCDYANKKGYYYRNGVQFGATQNLLGTPQFPSTNRAKYIGSYNSSLYKLTDGSLDEVRIYNRGLSDEEVATIYNQTKGNYQ